MHESHSGVGRSDAAEDLILRTIAAHAESLLRTARRHSICVDDAQDAYQRSIEIFMGRAHRLDGARAAGWLHVVVKREAQALRRSRQQCVAPADVDLDVHESQATQSPEERLLSFDTISRSAEALRRLKPQELRALWLRAEGHSYSEIGAITGWSYTKVNRCLTEGRRGFLDRYSGIESGAECDLWQPTLSAIVDGEATAEQLHEVRPHLRNCAGCRATVKALHDSSTPLAALLPVPLVAGQAAPTDQLPHFLLRLYESLAGGIHERAVHSLTKTQTLIEASAAGKVAAVAASAAAVAGGGYTSVEHALHRPADGASKPAAAASRPATQTSATTTAPAPTVTSPARTTPPARTPPARTSPPKSNVFAAGKSTGAAATAPEFRGEGVGSQGTAARFASASASSASTAQSEKSKDGTAGSSSPSPGTASTATTSSSGSAPEFGGGRTSAGAAPEFGP